MIRYVTAPSIRVKLKCSTAFLSHLAFQIEKEYCIYLPNQDAKSFTMQNLQSALLEQPLLVTEININSQKSISSFYLVYLKLLLLLHTILKHNLTLTQKKVLGLEKVGNRWK